MLFSATLSSSLDKSQQHVPLIRGGGISMDWNTHKQLHRALTCCCGPPPFKWKQHSAAQFNKERLHVLHEKVKVVKQT